MIPISVSTRLRDYSEHCYAYHIFQEIAARSGSTTAHRDDCLSEEFGFLVPTAPVTSFPDSHKIWDEAAQVLPEWVCRGRQRLELDKLPLLSAAAEDLPDEYVCRAITLISHLAHGYYMGDFFNGEAPSESLPEQLEQPWQQLSKRLGRPRVGMTGFESVLYNWKIRDESLEDPRVLENLDLLIPFFGNQEERVFNLAFLESSFVGSCMPLLCVQAQDAVVNNDQASLEILLKELISKCDRLTEHLLKLDPMPGSPNYLHPVIWAKTAPNVSSVYRPSEAGLSGGSVPIIHLLDIFLGRTSYKSEMGRQEQERRYWLPRGHIDFLNAVNAISVKGYIQQSKNETLVDVFNQLCESFSGKKGFLGIHRRKIYIYMELGFKAGRLATNAGLQRDSDEEPWMVVDHELEEGREERHRDRIDKLRYGRIEAIEPISEGISQVDISLDTGAVFQPGDRCTVSVENSPELISKTLKALHAKEDSQIRIGQEWQSYLRENQPELAGEIVLLRDFLRFAKIRPVTRQVAIIFYRLTGLAIVKEIIDQHIEDQYELWDFLQLIAPFYDTKRLWAGAPWQKENLSRILSPEPARAYSITSWVGKEKQHYGSSFSLAVGELSYETTASGKTITRHGTASSFLTNPKQVGKMLRVEFERPWFFSFASAKQQPLFLFTSGTGLSAFVGLLRSYEKHPHKAPPQLYYGCRDAKNLPLKDYLVDLAHKGVIGLHLAFSRMSEDELSDQERTSFAHKNISTVFGARVDHFLSDDKHSEGLAKAMLAPWNDPRCGYLYVGGRTAFYTTLVEALEGLLRRRGIESPKEFLDQLTAEKRLQTDLFIEYSPRQENTDGSIRYIPVSDIIDYNFADKGYWMVIGGVVYDLTDYLARHPGGDKILTANCGIDATKAYENVEHHMWQEIEALLKGYQIGLVHPLKLDGSLVPCMLNGEMVSISMQGLYESWVKCSYQLVEMQNSLANGYGIAYDSSEMHCKIIYDVHKLLPGEFLAKFLQLFLEPLFHMTAALTAQDRTLVGIRDSIKTLVEAIPKPPKALKDIVEDAGDYTSAARSIIELDETLVAKMKATLQNGLLALENTEQSAELMPLTDKLLEICQDYIHSLQKLYGQG